MATGNYTKGDQFVADGASKVTRIAAGALNKVWTSNGPGELPSWETAGGGTPGSGTMTSLTMPAEFSVADPTGDAVVTWATEAANLIFAGPGSGGAAVPGFRALVAADIPSLTLAKISDAGTAASHAHGDYDAAGAAASAQAAAVAASCQRASNLSDVANTTTARANLGLGSAAVASTGDFDAAGAAAAAQAASQPLDADLTALAALASAADKLPYATAAQTWALATFTAAGRAIVDDVDAAAQRTTLGLGTAATHAHGDYDASGAAAAAQAASQPLDATLTSIALLGTAADRGIYSTGIDTWAEFGLTAAGRAVAGAANAAAQRTALGLGTAAVLDDAASDGTTYGRKDGAWAAVSAGSGLTQPQVLARSLGA